MFVTQHFAPHVKNYAILLFIWMIWIMSGVELHSYLIAFIQYVMYEYDELFWCILENIWLIRCLFFSKLYYLPNSK